MYVISKQSRGTRNFYLVKSEREGKRVRLRTLAYLGTEKSGCDTVEKAIAYCHKELRKLGKKVKEAEEALEKEIAHIRREHRNNLERLRRAGDKKELEFEKSVWEDTTWPMRAWQTLGQWAEPKMRHLERRVEVEKRKVARVRERLENLKKFRE